MRSLRHLIKRSYSDNKNRSTEQTTRGHCVAQRVIIFALAFTASALISSASFAQGQDEKFLVRRLKFPNGKNAVTVTPESWTADPSGALLTTSGGIKISLENGKASTSGACDWAELQARFVDFPSDKNIDIDLHKREQGWYAPRGAADACMSFAISGRSGAVVMRTAFVSKGAAYGIRTERLSWGRGMDAAGFVSLERDMNIVAAYFFFEGTDGYSRFDKLLARGGRLIAPAQPAASAASGGEPASGTATAPLTATGAESASTTGSGVLIDDTGAAYCATGSELISASVLIQDADMQRAEKYKMNGRYAEAEAIYRGLLTKNPYDSRTGMGDVCVATGRYQEAVENLQIAVSLRPSAPAAYNGLGSVYFYQQAWDTARGFFNQALEVDPKNTVALSNLGWISLSADNDPAAAKKYFDEALQNVPEYNALAGVYSGLATVAIMRGDLDGALAYCSELISKMPGAAVAYTLRASVYLAKNDPTAAYDAASRARELAPDMRQAHAFAADAAMLLGRYNDSAVAYRMAVQTSPPGGEISIPYRLGLASALASSGDKPAALDTLRAALELFPGNKLIVNAISDLQQPASP